ncbi:hypothetical protein RRG08_006390 [Elysia crispata]|uniref:Uncharacterized protein n=1 Tax=Elysia crispata TaxID=231223 RepID=A0AAE0Y398_9GAST|nr:hypothetical protein RRG08_006390 [Elysia crispata]
MTRKAPKEVRGGFNSQPSRSVREHQRPHSKPGGGAPLDTQIQNPQADGLRLTFTTNKANQKLSASSLTTALEALPLIFLLGFTPLAFHTPVCSHKAAGTDADEMTRKAPKEVRGGFNSQPSRSVREHQRPHSKPGGGAPPGHPNVFKCFSNMQTPLPRLSKSAMTNQS